MIWIVDWSLTFRNPSGHCVVKSARRHLNSTQLTTPKEKSKEIS